MRIFSSLFHTMAFTCDILYHLWKGKSLTEAVLYVNRSNALFYQFRYEKKLREYDNNGKI